MTALEEEKIDFVVNLVPRVSHLTAPGGKMGDPGNEVASLLESSENRKKKPKNCKAKNCFCFRSK